MHGNQWVLKIAVLKYYSVSKRSTTAKSNPKQATDPISLHTKFGDNSSNTFPFNERKPCMTPDAGHQTSDGRKSKNNISTPRGVDIILIIKRLPNLLLLIRYLSSAYYIYIYTHTHGHSKNEWNLVIFRPILNIFSHYLQCKEGFIWV